MVQGSLCGEGFNGGLAKQHPVEQDWQQVTLRPHSRQTGLPAGLDMTATFPSDPAAALSQLVTSLDDGRGALAVAVLDMLDRADVLVAVKEIATGRYLHVNARMVALFGRAAQDLLGHTDAEFLDASQAASLRTADHATVSQGAALSIEHRVERNGQRREFSVTRVAISRGPGAVPVHLCSLWVEVTRERQREAQLEKLLLQLEQQQSANDSLRRQGQDDAERDDAMGLYQRTHFDDQLRREADLSAREHRQFSLVSIEIGRAHV